MDQSRPGQPVLPPLSLAARVQVAAVVLLFLAALAALLVVGVSAFWLPWREQHLRAELGAASARLAEEAAELLPDLPASGPPVNGLDARLSALTRACLAEVPGGEGGFLVINKGEHFGGFAHPGGPPPPSENEPRRREPPPLEGPYIRLQCRDSLDLSPGESLTRVREVGTSRVVVVTRPVRAGAENEETPPARLVVWVMARLTSPEGLLVQLHYYQVSTWLALASVVLALALTANLVRTVRQEQRARAALAEELRRAEHLASLGRLLAGVAHEVRNPLAGIRSTVQLWQRLPERALTPASLEAVIQAVDRLGDLVGRLLFFARAGQEERRPVVLGGVVREVLELLRARAEAQGVDCEVVLEPDLPPVAGSVVALQQVVLNLAQNALDAMPNGGRLRCRVWRVGREVELRVEDTGPGVPPQARAHLFEPFFTTRAEGTGLGLAMCREIVQQHGGRIELASAAGAGTAFRVVLLAAEDRPGR